MKTIFVLFFNFFYFLSNYGDGQFAVRLWRPVDEDRREVIPPPPPPPNYRFIPFETEPPTEEPETTTVETTTTVTTTITTEAPTTLTSTSSPTTTSTAPPITTTEFCDSSDDSFLMRKLKEKGLYNAIYMATDLYTASKNFPDLGERSFTLPNLGKYKCDEECEKESSDIRKVMASHSRKSLMRSALDIEIARARARVTDAPRSWWRPDNWRRGKREWSETEERELESHFTDLSKAEIHRQKRSAAELALMNSGTLDGILGTTIALQCDEATEESVPNTGYHLCRTCRAVRKLPEKYFPRVLNEVICAEGDCLRGDGKCTQRFLPFKILENIGTRQCPRWIESNVQIRTCCDCIIHPNSPFLRYVLPPN